MESVKCVHRLHRRPRTARCYATIPVATGRTDPHPTFRRWPVATANKLHHFHHYFHHYFHHHHHHHHHHHPHREGARIIPNNCEKLDSKNRWLESEMETSMSALRKLRQDDNCGCDKRKHLHTSWWQTGGGHDWTFLWIEMRSSASRTQAKVTHASTADFQLLPGCIHSKKKRKKRKQKTTTIKLR